MRYAAVVLLLGSSAGCLYLPPKLPQPGAGDTDSHAPIAVIRGGPDIRVGNAAWVYLDGSGSRDPDGDPLTFTWSLSGGCADVFPTETDQPICRFWSLPVGQATPCDVRLTVSDGVNESSVDATVTVVDVNAYVSGDDTHCARSSGDPQNDVGLGHPDNPWCKLEEGIAAARAFGLGSVFVAKARYVMDTTLQIPSSVTIEGGFDSGFDNSQPAANRADLAVAPPVGVRFEPGVDQWLFSVHVSFNGTCTSTSAEGCTLVSGRNSGFTIDSCDLGQESDGTVTTVAPDATFTAVAARGEEYQVTIASTLIQLPAQGSSLTGVLLESYGRGSAVLRGIEIRGPLTSPAFAVGVHSRWLDTLTIEGTSIITLETNGLEGDTGTTVAGVMDGDRLGMNGCPAPACNGSTYVYVTDASVLATNPTGNAYGVAYFSTRTGRALAFAANAKVSITAVGAGIVAGVHSISAGEIKVANEGGLGTEITADGGTTGRLTAALLDGLIDLEVAPFPSPVAESGSQNLRVSGARLETVAPLVDNNSASPALAAAAAILAGTAGGGIGNGSALVISAGAWPDNQVRAPTYAAGLWTLATANIAVTGATIAGPTTGFPPPTASNVLAGVLDGALDPESGETRLPSTSLHLWSNTVDLTFGELPEPAIAGGAACVMLVGSRYADVGRDPADGAATPSLVGCTDGRTPLGVKRGVLHEVWTLGTDHGSVHHTRTGVSTTIGGGATLLDAWLVDLRDGRAFVTAAISKPSLASTHLEIFDNLLGDSTNPVYVERYGLWLDHDPEAPIATDAATQVYDNVVFPAVLPAVDGWSTRLVATFGMQLDHAVASVFNNTIHGGRCNAAAMASGCDYLRHSSGLFLTGTTGQAVTLIDSNLIHGGDGANAMAVTDDAPFEDGATTGVWHPTALSFTGNVLLGKRLYNATGAYHYLDLQIVTGGPPTWSTVDDVATTDLWLDSNSVATEAEPVAAWPLCPDGIHVNPLATVGSTLGYIIDGARNATYADTDIDGVTRLTGIASDSADVGADEMDPSLVCGG